jgi:predicted TIM-barrel fold metal-dependent hydrolase
MSLLTSVRRAVTSFGIVVLALLGGPASAQERPASVIPIVDVHFHYMPFMRPDALQERMQKNNIVLAISAGAIGGPAIGDPRTRDAEVLQLLGESYIPASGAGELYRAERAAGLSLFTDLQSPHRADALARLMEQKYAGRRAIPETFPNAENSSVDPLRRRRVPTDGPFFQELMKFAVQEKIPLPMHMEWHPDSVLQLGNLLRSFPDGVVVLSHCGKITVADDIRRFFEKHTNVYCDLGYRGAPLATQESTRDPNRMIYWPDGLFRKADIKPDWLKLITDFPDRFMMAIDDVHSWGQYDEVVAAIRFGVLDKLDKSTAEKVAYQNAINVYRLSPGILKKTDK